MDEKNISNSVANNENQQQSQQTKLDADAQITDECLLCSEQKRDTVFKPCGHVIACEGCGSRIKKCLICRETVSSREKVSLRLAVSEKLVLTFASPADRRVHRVLRPQSFSFLQALRSHGGL
jgi:hypothetical protein